MNQNKNIFAFCFYKMLQNVLFASKYWQFVCFILLCKVARATTSQITSLALYESSESVYLKQGIIHTKPEEKFKLLLLGKYISKIASLSFSKVGKKEGKNCNDDRFTNPVTVDSSNSNEDYKIQVNVDFSGFSDLTLYVCVKEHSNTSEWVHQGKKDDLKIVVLKKGFIIPMWLKIMLIAILMALSGLFSGLNLGLMSLDPNELKLVQSSGSKAHKKYASKILPVRRHGNFLLCTLLLGNTLVNSSFTILLDSLTGGIVAVIGSTLAIVVMGEIVPQSICSRYGLAVGAYTIYLTKLFMVLTFPISYPISKLLDCILGKELGNVYNRHQLLEMLRLQNEYNDLEQDEVGIITGALKYREKIVEEVMTSLEDCFLLDEEAVLDFATMTSIIRTGYSRIPIFSGERSNIVAVLFVKDLAFVDPDDCIPLLSVIKFYNHPVHKVFNDTTLDKILEEFKQGTTHLSVVTKVNDQGEGDPFYESIGIVTLEDIIEEIIQAEIVDETDVYFDNVSGKKVQRKKHQVNQDFSLFLPTAQEITTKISPQLAFAIYQYLSTAVPEFREELISRTVLKKLIQHPGVIEDKVLVDEKQEVYLYQKGKPAEYFCLIVQGRVEVTVGAENIVFEDGPFSLFGVTALTVEHGQQFIADFTVKVIKDVEYLEVSRSVYRSAIRASKMERENKSPEQFQEFDEIFWLAPSPAGAQGEVTPDTHSHKSEHSGSERGTPIRNDRKHRSLLRRLKEKKKEEDGVVLEVPPPPYPQVVNGHSPLNSSQGGSQDLPLIQSMEIEENQIDNESRL